MRRSIHCPDSCVSCWAAAVSGAAGGVRTGGCPAAVVKKAPPKGLCRCGFEGRAGGQSVQQPEVDATHMTCTHQTSRGEVI